MRTEFIKDSQSRVTRYGMKCHKLINGYKVQQFAHADKKGNTLVISKNFSDCINNDGESIAGIYKILEIGKGKIATVLCEKINSTKNNYNIFIDPYHKNPENAHINICIENDIIFSGNINKL